MTQVIGVDFSGAQTDKNTWITEAELTVDTPDTPILKLNGSKSIRRNDLTKRLGEGDYSVAAMDFPFSVPRAFAEYLVCQPSAMPELWRTVGEMCLNEFIDKRNCYVGDDRQREHLRAGDLHASGCFSCLHDTNPNMIPMTYYGMKMLHELHTQASGPGFKIPPLQITAGACPVLLEVMPGAILQSLRLPEKNPGKAYKRKDEKAKARREEILDGLEKRSKIRLPNLKNGNYEDCVENHDRLDSVVATVAAAMWELGSSRFRCPSKTYTVNNSGVNYQRLRRTSPGVQDLIEFEAAQLEGWLYAPNPINH